MKKTILLISILSVFYIGCKKDFSDHYPYYPPENINDGLDVGTLKEVNIDPEMIAKAVGRIHNGKYNEVHSLLIFKDDKLVFEEYFQGHKYSWTGANYHGKLVKWDRDMLHSVMSVTKSITSTCIGIAIDQGFIDNVHQSIFDYLPDHQHLNTSGKDKITILHLLTMTPGLEWKEWGVSYKDPKSDIANLVIKSNNPVNYVLNKHLKNDPGKNFTYSGGNMIVLAEILKNATSMDLDEFSGEYLFEPLGINPYYWSYTVKSDVIDAAGSLLLTPRDMAKIGVTFLNSGVWNGEQIVSAEWVGKCASAYQGNTGINPSGLISGKHGYSYSWWTKTYSCSGEIIKLFSASGWGGQEIMVIPDLQTVVVFTGGNYKYKNEIYEILERFILPAII